MSTGSTGKPGFDEAYVSPDLDPLDSHSADFDWGGLMQRLGEFDDREIDRGAEAFRVLVTWLIAPGQRTRGTAKSIAQRTVVAGWVLSPALFEGSPSLTRLAKQMGIHKVILSRHAAAFSKRFGIRNRAQRAHDWRPGRKGGGNE